MVGYSVDTGEVRTVLAAVGVKGSEFADVRTATRTATNDAAAACGNSRRVATAIRGLRDGVIDAEDLIEHHVETCITAVTAATIAYETADVEMAASTSSSAEAATGLGQPW